MNYNQIKRFTENNGVSITPFDNKQAILAKMVNERLKRLEIETGTAENVSNAPENWRDWAHAIFPTFFTSEFIPAHIEFWEWLWQAADNLKHGRYTRPIALFLPRGFGKSVMMAAAMVKLGCEGHAPYMRYVSTTSPQASDLMKEGILDALQKSSITDYYPYASEPRINEVTGRRSSWSATEISIRATTIQSMGLMEQGARGGRKGSERVSLYIIDDIENDTDSPIITKKKVDRLTKSLLPAMKATGGIIMFAQNLIHENSIANMIATKQADFLADMKVVGPLATVDNLKYESRYRADIGRNWFFITGGTPTWPDLYSLDVCEKRLNEMGVSAFLSEMQNDVTVHIGAVYHGYFSDENIDSNVCPDPTKPIDLCYDDGFTNDPRIVLFLQQDGVGGDIIVFDEIVHYGKLAGDMVNAVYNKIKEGWDLTDEMVLKIEAEGRLNDVYRIDEEISETEIHMYEEIGLGHRIEKVNGKWHLSRYYHKNIYKHLVFIHNKKQEIEVAFGGDQLIRSLVGKNGEFETPAAFKDAFGLRHYPVKSEIEEGIKKTRKHFKDEHGIRHVKVHPRCKVFISEHRSGYRTDLNGKPIDTDNHASDAFRYWVQRFGF